MNQAKFMMNFTLGVGSYLRILFPRKSGLTRLSRKSGEVDGAEDPSNTKIHEE